MHRFQIIPVFLRTAGPDDILIATEGNFSILRPPKVLVEQNIQLPALVNSSDLDVSGHARVYIHEGIFEDIVLPALSNSSTLEGGSPTVAFVEVQEAPPTGFIRLPTIVNGSVLSGGSPSEAFVSIGEAPADGFIRLPSLTNNSLLSSGSPAIANVSISEEGEVPTEADDDNDPMIADGMVGGRMI